jgi:hypothetical protein
VDFVTKTHHRIYTITKFNRNNTNSLIKALYNIEINENSRMGSFDIKNMYTNVTKADYTYHKNCIKEL